jgi:hypothetical protein
VRCQFCFILLIHATRRGRWACHNCVTASVGLRPVQLPHCRISARFIVDPNFIAMVPLGHSLTITKTARRGFSFF